MTQQKLEQQFDVNPFQSHSFDKRAYSPGEMEEEMHVQDLHNLYVALICEAALGAAFIGYQAFPTFKQYLELFW